MIKKYFKTFLLSIVFCFALLNCTNDNEPTQYSDWLIGNWQIENTDEYIYFTNRDIFIMNDTLNGSYEIQDKDDKIIWFYVISDSEEYEDDGEMIFTNIDYHKSMTVQGMPLHQDETIKILYKD